jgi:hypothetical protein
MYALMSLHTVPLTEWLITRVAAKWLLPAMYALMSFQTELLTE